MKKKSRLTTEWFNDSTQATLQFLGVISNNHFSFHLLHLSFVIEHLTVENDNSLSFHLN